MAKSFWKIPPQAKFLDTETDTVVRYALTWYCPFEFLRALTDIMQSVAKHEELETKVENILCADMARYIEARVLPRYAALNKAFTKKEN